MKAVLRLVGTGLAATTLVTAFACGGSDDGSSGKPSTSTEGGAQDSGSSSGGGSATGGSGTGTGGAGTGTGGTGTPGAGGGAVTGCTLTPCEGKTALGQTLTACCQDATTCGVTLGMGGQCFDPALLDRFGDGGNPFGDPETIVPDTSCAGTTFALMGNNVTLAGCCDKSGVCGVSTADFPSTGGFTIPAQCITPAESQRFSQGADAGPDVPCSYPDGG